MVEHVEELAPEFHPEAFIKLRHFLKTNFPVVNARAAANRARSIADRSGYTVASVKLLFGSNPALIGWQSTPVPAVGPVPNAHTVFFGLMDLNGATTFGWPGVSKSKLDCSSISSCSVMRTGKPA